MENLFEGAGIGDKFLTRDGSIAFFVCKRTDGSKYDLSHPYALIIDGINEIWHFYPSGNVYVGVEVEQDIVSRYQESIDEEKLDDLAYNYACSVSDYDEIVSSNDISAFKAGYHKAMEEK